MKIPFNKWDDVDYYINDEKQIVTAVLKDPMGWIVQSLVNKPSAEGISVLCEGTEDTTKLYPQCLNEMPDYLVALAYCNPDDEFDEDIGIDVAFNKLITKFLTKRNSILKGYGRIFTELAAKCLADELEGRRALVDNQNRLKEIIAE